jgi:hypothetical protein
MQIKKNWQEVRANTEIIIDEVVKRLCGILCQFDNT